MSEKGYCVKCRIKRVMEDEEVEQSANGRYMLRGICSRCGTKITRFLGNDDPLVAEAKPAKKKTAVAHGKVKPRTAKAARR